LRHRPGVVFFGGAFRQDDLGLAKSLGPTTSTSQFIWKSPTTAFHKKSLAPPPPSSFFLQHSQKPDVRQSHKTEQDQILCFPILRTEQPQQHTTYNTTTPPTTHLHTIRTELNHVYHLH
jgi:hypothetical protein